MAKLSYADFIRKWPDTPSVEDYRKYITDCYNMYETEGFCKTFQTTYSDYVKYNGKKFKKLRRAKIKDGFDYESLPAWYIEFEEGVHIFALPEESCKIERNK